MLKNAEVEFFEIIQIDLSCQHSTMNIITGTPSTINK